MIPVFATNLGADLSLSGFIASLIIVGALLGNLPAGWTIARLGERLGMIIAAVVALVSTLGIIGAVRVESLAVLAVSVLLLGISTATFNLARVAFMTSRVPYSFRARSIALLGGSYRLGMFIGPFLASWLLTSTGTPLISAWIFIGALAAVIALVLIAPDPERALPLQATGPTALDPQSTSPQGTWAAVRSRWRPFITVGGACAILMGLRSVRPVLVPLWGLSIGLDAGEIAFILGLTGAIDFALFYTSGQIMDRFGRAWSAVPAVIMLGITFGILSLTHDLDSARTWLYVVAILIGISNGPSSGVVMTLGADLAPRSRPAPFLAGWQLLTGAGGAVTPLAVSALAAVSLPLASAGLAVLSLVGAALFLKWLPKYMPRQ